MKKILCLLLTVLLAAAFPLVGSGAAKYMAFPECIRSAECAVLYDAVSEKTVYSLNADKEVAMASLTKLMTASAALKYCSEDEVFTVGSELSLVKPNSSLCRIYEGEQLTLRQLLCGLLIPSGNDAAYTIAVGVARKQPGSESLTDAEAAEKFCSMMNAYAKAIGAKSTNFVNPDGWDEEEHRTTANDLVLITKEALTYKTVEEIVASPSVTETLVSGRTVTWENSNLLIRRYSKYYCPFSAGVKTGTTDDAGYCLAARAVRGGRDFICVVLNCPDEHSRCSTAALLLDLALNGRPFGDADENYTVDPADARLILSAAAGETEVTGDMLFAADADRDGRITAADARYALRAAIGLEDRAMVLF